MQYAHAHRLLCPLYHCTTTTPPLHPPKLAWENGMKHQSTHTHTHTHKQLKRDEQA